MTRILILGGTHEAAKLASDLVARGNVVTTSLAGRTKEPSPISGEVRIGGFGGAQGLAHYLVENNIEKLIDATHPFAKTISQNAIRAAETTGVDFEQRTLPPWTKEPDDDWLNVPNLEAAVDAIPAGARVLLALGSQHISPFARRGDVHFLVRMIDPPNTPLPFPDHELVIARPSTDWREESGLLERHGISHIVCRNSGGTGAYAKIEAARRLSVNVIMIERIAV